MHIGVPREIKAQEYRVGLTPGGVRELVQAGHSVWVETQAGAAIGFADDLYRQAGATILDTAAELFAHAELIVKVKEPQADEIARLKPHHLLFTFLHLAPDPQQAQGLMASGAACIAYETVTDAQGALPLLAPMSEVAGRLSIQAAARCLEKSAGGSGVLLGGVPGVPPAQVVVLGGGVVGWNAARMAVGLGARVAILDKSLSRLKWIDDLQDGRITTLYSTAEILEEWVLQADAVIGAVLIPGAAAPKLVSEDLIGRMKPGSVVVDVAIDQGGCFATSRPTTHQQPTFIQHGVVHYCVANMPGAVARTSTLALTNATLPYVLALARQGLAACKTNQGLMTGLNVLNGKITHAAVADALGLDFHDPRILNRF
jgi:alanine dehydrogenase